MNKFSKVNNHNRVGQNAKELIFLEGFDGQSIENIVETWLMINKKGTLIAKQYYENGQLEVERTYKNGKENGVAKRYHENGQLEAKGTYKNGKEDGVWNFYYENGQLRYEITYKLGITISYRR
jgi:antitoxin component YwqK of YwqJK toxin-antitoxin module